MQTILIVDDHPDIRRLLSVTLGKSYQILEAENGASALDLIQKHRPRVVLLDVMMPGDMNGMDVLKTIKGNQQTRLTLVGMISARGQDIDSEEARLAGADAYFIKPFSPLQVVNWVRGQLG